MRIPMLNAARLHRPLLSALHETFDSVLRTGQFIGGEFVETFEFALAAKLCVSRAVGVSSGTDALLVALSALGVGPGDEVITTPYTFVATASAAVRLGAKPVFVDIDPGTFNIDASQIQAAISTRTVGIIPVHLFGQCANMAAVQKIADDAGVWVLEDAAQSFGAVYQGRNAGAMGTAGIFSFFPAKNLGALGDAGAAVTCDPVLAEKMTALRNHGAKEKNNHTLIGGNHRLDALQAAFLSVKLLHLSDWERARKQSAKSYRCALSNMGDIVLPACEAGAEHVYNQFVIRTQHRDALRDHLAADGIETAVYYPRPLHLQPCFEQLGYRDGDFPEAERAARETLALPMDPMLTPVELDRITKTMRSFFEARGRL